MIDLETITSRLASQAEAIRALVEGISVEQARWKPSPDDWSILEVIHHLNDLEIEDFRIHLDHILHRADQPWPGIDPQSWVAERRYNEQDPAVVLAGFLERRQESLTWLRSLGSPSWETAVVMSWATLSAGDMLASWAAHDLLHLRQLAELHYRYTLQAVAPFSPAYAGDW